MFQRTGGMPPLQDLYGKVPRGPSLGPRPGMEEIEFSDDDDRTPLTEPIYNGREVIAVKCLVRLAWCLV